MVLVRCAWYVLKGAALCWCECESGRCVVVVCVWCFVTNVSVCECGQWIGIRGRG